METTVQSERAFDGKLLKLDVLDVELSDGRKAVREVIRHPGAAVILAQLPDDRFVLVRQYRKAAETYLLEAVAGTLDPDESPENCAHRELLEETGYRADALAKLGTAFPVPGYSEEQHYFFYARLHATRGETQPDEDETVECVYLTHDEIEARILAGNIRDEKTLAAWLLYLRSEHP